MKKYDCMIVCGYPAKENGEPSELMKTRVERAVELWENKRASYLIFSGAAVANRHVEAQVMKSYAVSLGVPKDNYSHTIL